MSRLGTTSVVGILLLAAGLAGSAQAQNALGNGRALERKDAKKYPQSDQPRGGRDFAAEVQFRNSIVTGNAPGGASFRGNAGYSAPNTFRGATGSDDLYSYRRDSFYSGLSGQGIRGTEALQYQFAMSTGSSIPRGIVGSLGVGRAGDSSVTLARDTGREAAVQRDEHSGSDWLRSPSAYTSSRSLKPTALGERPHDETSYYRLMSSSLLGLKVQKVDLPRRDAGAAPDPNAAANTAVPTSFPTSPTSPTNPSATNPSIPGTTAPGSNTPGTTTKPPANPANPNTPAPKPVNVDPAAAFRTSYDQVVERLAAWKRAESPSATPGANPGSNPGATPGKPSDATTPGGKPGDADASLRQPWERRVEALRRHLLGLPAREVGDKDSAPLGRDDAVSVLNPETLRMIREGGGEVKVLAEVPDKRASLPLYARAMAAGQEQLAARKYFEAEDRFSRALAVRPRDPAAQAGRIHAQLGAGMYLSASINLRELAASSPETAGARYDAALLPSPERLKEIREVLRSRLGSTDNSDLITRSLGQREIGFILAYVGYQTGNAKDVKDGLDAVAKDATDSEEDKLILRVEKYLRGVWLGELPPEVPDDAIPTPAPKTESTPDPKPNTKADPKADPKKSPAAPAPDPKKDPATPSPSK